MTSITQNRTIRPGVFVGLRTSITGNVLYAKEIIENEHIIEDGVQKARWETTRTVMDPVEHEAAKKARSKATAAIRKVCVFSDFIGLLCPAENIEKLDKAIEEARRICDEFNATAKISHMGIYIPTFKVASDDVEAVKAINAEVRGLMDDMERGIERLDVQMIREAASQAKNLGGMLSQEAEARVRIAVDTARETAKDIVKANGSTPPTVDLSAMRKIAELRTAFLDLDDAKDVAAPAADLRALDFAPRPRADLE